MKPFFIVGAPRSGTTMLRDLLKQIDGLYSPEETHFFRWAAPFRGNEYNSTYQNNKVLEKHRQIDEISDEDFASITEKSLSKGEMTNNYCEKIASIKGAQSWFEKSPQNIYGLPLIAKQLPTCKVVNIIRHPYDVVKSLLVGKVIKVDDVVGAANYWNEAVDISLVCEPFLKERMITIFYEELVQSPDLVMSSLQDFLGFDKVITTEHVSTRSVNYLELLNNEQRKKIDMICGENMIRYGYKTTTN